MARRPSITAEEIIAAADKLHADGRAVSVRAVYEELGRKGDYRLYSETMSAWRDSQGERDELAELEIPEEIAKRGSEFIASMWKAATGVATTGREALQGEIVKLKEDSRRALAEAAEMTEIIERERDETREALEAREGDLRDAAMDRARIETENVRLTERIESRRGDVVKAEERADQAETRATGARIDLEHAREKMGEVEAELNASRAETKEVRAELTSKVSKVESLQADLGTARADLVKERAEHTATRERLSERLERATVDLERAEEARDQMAARNAELLAEIEALKTRISEQDSLIAVGAGKATGKKGA